MGKKWVPAGQYWRMPHATERPPSLWWYARQPDPTWTDDRPTPETECVIASYLHQCARGRKLPKNFEEKLRQWLQDLNREQQISPRKKRYWTITTYASAQRLPEKTLCKRFRELEKIAKRLFPLRVPASRKPVVLSEEKIQAMRKRVSDGVDISAVASEFVVPLFRVGQLCRKEKAARLAERDKVIDEHKQTSPAKSPTEESSFSDLPF
jgi:hypothetical protein